MEKFLADNLGNINDVGGSITGKALLLCDGKGPKVIPKRLGAEVLDQPYEPPSAPSSGALPSGKPLALLPGSDPAPDARAGGVEAQLDALMRVKASVDVNGVLSSWTRSAGVGGGYCLKFEGVECDTAGDVQGIALDDIGVLGGTLPPPSALAALPRLDKLHITEARLRGGLPPGYGALPLLADVRLNGNSLSGPIPREWAQMGSSGLKVLWLQ